MKCTEVGAKQPSAIYLETILNVVTSVEANIPHLTEIAEIAADRLVAGGRLFVTEDGGGFISEVSGRAGGIMMMKPLKDVTDPTYGDVVLAGTLSLDPEAQAAKMAQLRQQGAYVILFGSAESPLKVQADAFINNTLPLGTVPQVKIDDQCISPAATVANITAVWTFLAELIGACTRRGKMPTMYQSAFLEASKIWNPKHSQHAFHDDFTPPAMPPGSIGRTYLSNIRRCFEGIQLTQLDLFSAAGQLAAKALKSGSKTWCYFEGHHLPSQIGLPGDPGLFAINPQSTDDFAPGDIFIWIGYYHIPQRELDMVAEAGIDSIWVNGAREIHPLDLAPDRIIIDPYWGFGDAVVSIPGYAIRVLPPSGVIQTACLWMIAAEIACVAR